MKTINNTQQVWLAIILLFIAMISIQGGAALSKTLFPVIGPEGVTALRIGISSLILLAYFRPWRHKPKIVNDDESEATKPASNLTALVIYGLSLGTMNYCFYVAIQTIPLGIGVALEFTGPLAVALFSSRRLIDFVWVIFAIIGLALILPFASDVDNIDPKGAIYALIAGMCWAIYILAGKRTGTRYGTGSVALGTCVAAVVFFPLGVVQASSSIFVPEILWIGLFVALLTSAIPYSLEMYSMTQLPQKTFGTLLSLEPALATVSGILFLGEHLTLSQWLGLLAIIIASAGATMTLQRK